MKRFWTFKATSEFIGSIEIVIEHPAEEGALGRAEALAPSYENYELIRIEERD